MTPKVLHLIDHNGLGGAQQIVRGILLHRQNDAVLPIRYKKPIFFSTSFYNGNRIWHSSLVNSVLLFSRLGSIIESVQADLLHCHLQLSWLGGILFQRANFGRRIPLVFHEHNPYAARSAVYRSIVRAASHCGFIIAVSPHIYENLQRIGVAETRLRLIPNFVALPGEPRPFQPSTELTKPGDRMIIGYAGRLVPEKGWVYAFNAFRELSSERVELWIAGSGKDEARARQWVEHHGYADQIRFLGNLTDMTAFYRAIDIFLHPALEEPFGLAPLEAQTFGKPVAAFRFKGSEELFGESAMLAPLGDVHALADVLRRLVKDASLRETLGRCGLSNVKRFSPARFFESLEAVYEDSLKEPHR